MRALLLALGALALTSPPAAALEGLDLGKPTRRRRGRFVFKPATATDRSHAIQAVISQNGLPRDRVVAGRFKAPAP